MAYRPKTWINRQVEKPKTYNIQNNTDGTITLLSAEGIVIEEGTPLEAASMNEIEIGLAEVSNTVGDGIRDYTRQPAFATTAGTSTAYTVTLSPAPTAILDGFGITIVPHVTNGTNATLNIDGLGAFPLKKQNGQNYPSGRVIAGKPYSFRKVGTDFLADSAGGSGTALPAHVLAPYTFTNDTDELVGTMVTITSGEDPALGVGQHINGDLAVYPREGYRKGGSGAGEIRVTTAQLQSVDPEFRADRILENNNIFGVGGSIPNNSTRDHHMAGRQTTTWVGDRVFIQPPYGFYNGDSWVTTPCPTLVPNNIRAGTNVLGVGGTLREYFGGAFPLRFRSPGPGTPVGGYYEAFRIPSGWSNISFAGMIYLWMSSTNVYQRCSFVVQDIHGQELTLTAHNYVPNYNQTNTTHGLFVDRINRQFTTVFAGSGYENSGGWMGESDIKQNGTFTKPMNLDNQLIFYFKVEASMGGGYTSLDLTGKVAYN